MRDENFVCYTIGLQILIFHLDWIANPAEQDWYMLFSMVCSEKTNALVSKYSERG